jgi:hypothetical protein
MHLSELEMAPLTLVGESRTVVLKEMHLLNLEYHLECSCMGTQAVRDFLAAADRGREPLLIAEYVAPFV